MARTSEQTVSLDVMEVHVSVQCFCLIRTVMQKLEVLFNKHWGDVFYSSALRSGGISLTTACDKGNGRDTKKNDTFLLTDDCEFS